MSNDKEFDKVADYNRLLLANVKLHNKINSQQKIIEQKDEEIERLKKDNDLLLKCVKRYAGYPERRINGRPEKSWNCEGFNWIVRKHKASWLGKRIFWEKDHKEYVHVYINNIGMIECGGGSEIAEKTLKELGERNE